MNHYLMRIGESPRALSYEQKSETRIFTSNTKMEASSFVLEMSSEASVCVLDVDGACEWVGQLIAEINGHVQHVANAVLEGGEVGLNEE